MTREPNTIAFWNGRLPHWEVEGHLAGAIPAVGRAQLRRVADQLRHMPEGHQPERLRLHREIFAEMERWLDRSQWNPLLRHTDIAAMVVEAIEHRHKRGDWQVFEYVVMPTHIHLFCEMGSAGLKHTLEDFKRWTGHQAGKHIDAHGKAFWQGEWFDHWSRSDEEDERIIAYIRNNPVKAGLVQENRAWPYGSWR